MCKHILNAQVSIRSPCCRKWFDCALCHEEAEPNHALLKTLDMTFACKKCKKCFRKNAETFEEADEYCPHCDNHFVIDAIEPKAALGVEGGDSRMEGGKMLRDARTREGNEGFGMVMGEGGEVVAKNEGDKKSGGLSLFDFEGVSERLG